MGALAAPGPPFDMHADTCQVLRIPMMFEVAELLHAAHILRSQLRELGNIGNWFPGVDGKIRPVKTCPARECYL